MYSYICLFLRLCIFICIYICDYIFVFIDLYVHMYHINENYGKQSFIYVPNSKPNPIIYQLLFINYIEERKVLVF
jgi:hypothetical protein